MLFFIKNFCYKICFKSQTEFYCFEIIILLFFRATVELFQTQTEELTDHLQKEKGDRLVFRHTSLRFMLKFFFSNYV